MLVVEAAHVHGFPHAEQGREMNGILFPNLKTLIFVVKVVQDIGIGARDLGYDSRADQISPSVSNGLPSRRRFCVAQASSRGGRSRLMLRHLA